MGNLLIMKELLQINLIRTRQNYKYNNNNNSRANLKKGIRVVKSRDPDGKPGT